MGFYDLIWGLAGWIEGIVTGIAGFFSALFSFIQAVFTMVSIMVSILPPSWSALLLVGLSISTIYTIYSWIKDISIGGFKI